MSRISVYAISWTSGLVRSVARSTSTAKFLAVADAVDQVTFLRATLSEVDAFCTTELIRDSKTTFHLCFRTREPQEVKNTLMLASIREEHHRESLPIIHWSSGMSHLTDALTKNNITTAKYLDEVLTRAVRNNQKDDIQHKLTELPLQKAIIMRPASNLQYSKINNYSTRPAFPSPRNI